MDEIELVIMDQHRQIHDFIKTYTDEKGNIKFYLYKNRNTGVRQCFSPYDINILKNWGKNTTKVVETRQQNII